MQNFSAARTAVSSPQWHIAAASAARTPEFYRKQRRDFVRAAALGAVADIPALKTRSPKGARGSAFVLE